jgi:hypothetical protein
MTPLSDHEKKQLLLLEEQFHAEDPKFVKTMRSKGSFWKSIPQKHRQIFSLVGISLGTGIFSVGVAMPNILIGVLGMVLCIISVHSMLDTFERSAQTFVLRPQARRTFMENLEYKWDERKKNDL